MMMLIAQLTSAGGDLGGYSGWAGAGLLGLVLAWLLFKHLPDKDRQLKDMLDANDRQLKEVVMIADSRIEAIMKAQLEERKEDRTSRHNLANMFQASISQLQTEHNKDAEKDRESFFKRQDRLEDALKLQTAELKMAIAQAACRFMPPPADRKS